MNKGIYFIGGLIAMLWGCGITKKTKAEEIFDLPQISRMQTFAGVAGVPSVVDYRFMIIAKRTGVFEIDSAWAEQNRMKVQVDRKTNTAIAQDETMISVEKGDSVYLRGSFEIPMPCDHCLPPPTHLAYLYKVPVETEHLFVLRFRHKSADFYIASSKVERLPDQNMP